MVNVYSMVDILFFDYPLTSSAKMSIALKIGVFLLTVNSLIYQVNCIDRVQLIRTKCLQYCRKCVTFYTRPNGYQVSRFLEKLAKNQLSPSLWNKYFMFIGECQKCRSCTHRLRDSSVDMFDFAKSLESQLMVYGHYGKTNLG